MRITTLNCKALVCLFLFSLSAYGFTFAPALVSHGFQSKLTHISGSSIQSLTNVQKLSLPANTAVGTQGSVSDGFVVSGTGTSADGLFFAPDGTLNSKPSYTAQNYSADQLTARWQDKGPGFKWYIEGQNVLGVLFESDDDVVYPWLVITWIDNGNGIPTLTHPAVQQLAAPSTAQGGVFVSGGTQDGIYSNRDTLVSDKPLFNLLGQTTGSGGNGSIDWNNVRANAWCIADTGGAGLYYSLSNVATPDLASKWVDTSVNPSYSLEVTAGPPGSESYGPDGTSFPSTSTYNQVGSDWARSDGLTEFRFHQTGGHWVATWSYNGGEESGTIETSLDNTAAPFASVWPTIRFNSDASIMVTSVTQGELDAGVTVAGAGEPTSNEVIYSKAASSGRYEYDGPTGNYWVWNTVSWYSQNSALLSNPYHSNDNVAFPWQATFTPDSHSPAPTVTRNNVAAEANWEVVP